MKNLLVKGTGEISRNLFITSLLLKTGGDVSDAGLVLVPVHGDSGDREM